MFDQSTELARTEAALDALLVAPPSPGSAREASALIRSVERCARKLRAAQIQLQGELESSGVYAGDGHPSAKAMTRHCGRLSPSAAKSRERGSRMVATLPDVWAALERGELGVDQFDLLGRVHANPRVREHMVEAQSWFLRIAGRLSFADFEAEVRRWEQFADEDGPEPRNSARHETRNVSLLQDKIDLGWELKGSFGAMQGAFIDDVFGHYISAERLADWEKAKAEHGDEATANHLPRTEAQRRADALWQVFADAAKADGSASPVDFVHNVVWSHTTFEEMLRRLAGEEPQHLDPADVRCHTLDGVPLEPLEAAANALVSKMRRVVTYAAGVVTDLGRARFFTGGARLAVQLSEQHCLWPGCSVPTSQCEIDHSVDHSQGGRTNPGNGGPFCGKHNRHKQKGFAVWRDPAGEWHIYRPDGTEIE
jgi:hypothetical protein